ncbi:hypothetical protein chiPu_0007518 [Chiloscyllium punctatum]|uniref:Uncharacterized protein n=1 Tax=Chiloscyllium punctatum TaxID=137246 RepID=A0A401SFC0_CHIPU|nr:hypothetical protein [Chiloscyllium punctatum]
MRRLQASPGVWKRNVHRVSRKRSWRSFFWLGRGRGGVEKRARISLAPACYHGELWRPGVSWRLRARGDGSRARAMWLNFGSGDELLASRGKKNRVRSGGASEKECVCALAEWWDFTSRINPG